MPSACSSRALYSTLKWLTQQAQQPTILDPFGEISLLFFFPWKIKNTEKKQMKARRYFGLWFEGHKGSEGRWHSLRQVIMLCLQLGNRHRFKFSAHFLLHTLRLQPIGWCHPLSGGLYPSQLNHYRKALRNIPGAVSMVILNPVKPAVKIKPSHNFHFFIYLFYLSTFWNRLSLHSLAVLEFTSPKLTTCFLSAWIKGLGHLTWLCLVFILFFLGFIYLLWIQCSACMCWRVSWGPLSQGQRE